MKQDNVVHVLPTRRPIMVLLSGGLWLVSAVLALLAIFALREIFIWGLAALLPQPDQASKMQAANFINLAQNCMVVILGIIGLGVIIGSGDYFFRHAGESRLLRALIGIIVVESVIVLPIWLIFWRH